MSPDGAQRNPGPTPQGARSRRVARLQLGGKLLMERRLAALLNADVVGYSSLMGKDEAGTLRALKAYEGRVIEPTIARHRGRIVKRMGDGYLAEFTSVVDATESALAWQQQPTAEDEQPLKFRIGVHLGDIIVEE